MIDFCKRVSVSGQAFLLAVLTVVWTLPASAAAFRIENGILDLRAWDPLQDPVIDLGGDAEFYWQQLIVSEPQSRRDPELLEISQTWNKAGRYSAFGYASYRVKILLPDSSQDLSLYLTNATTRAQAFINGNLALDVGRATRSQAENIIGNAYSQRPRLAPIASVHRELELVYEISNWDTSVAAGFWDSVPKIGVTQRLEETIRTRLSIDTSFLAVCLVMGIYHLILFALRRDDKSNLFFSLMALFIAANFGAFSQSVVLELIGSTWIFKTRIVLLYCGWLGSSVSLFYFVAHIFPNEAKMKWAHIFAIITLPFVCVVFVMPVFQALPILSLYQICTMSALFYILVATVNAVKAKRTGSRIFLGIASVVFFAVLHDLLLGQDLINSKPVIMYATLFFLLGQSALISMRFAQAFRQVQILSNEITEKEKARTVFFHNTSHELRTPLNGILGFLDLVRGGHYGPVPEKAKVQIDKAWRLAESLKIQVNTILDLAKSKRGDLRLTASSIDLAQLKKDCDVLAEGLQLKFPGTRYFSQLDDIVGSRRWDGDREKILTIIRNLLGNAFKFCSPDRANEVRLILEHRQGELMIRVSDQGIGIASEAQSKIFDEFSQAQSDARRSYEGTGLGLAMVRDLVKLSQGSIQLESTPGKGSLFLVTLSKLDVKHLAEETTPDEAKVTVSDVNEDGSSIRSLAAENTAAMRDFAAQFRLLVVDDNPGNLEVIQDILGLDGYQIELADGGRKAMQALSENMPDLMILDLMMPEVSGEDVLRFVRSDQRLKDLPVIILTARASDQDRIASLGLGADEYMSKPFDPRELSLRIYNTIERRELQRQALDAEHRQRLSDLGELFNDLSHELKNIFQLPHADPQKLSDLFPELWRRGELPQSTQDVLKKAFDTPPRITNRFGLFEQIQKAALQKWPGESRRKAARILAFGALDEPAVNELWQSLQELPANSFASLQDQLDMSEQFVMLQEALYRGRDLALSALDIERMGHGHGKSHITEVISSIKTLMQARLRKAGVELRCEVPKIELAVAPGVLQQVLLNLLSNACDAIGKYPVESRWIEISYRDDHEFSQLRISNGGAKIEETIAKRVFRRGFSTKGGQGNGLGLALSQRLIREQGGDLGLDLKDEHTTFVVSFAKSKQEKLA